MRWGVGVYVLSSGSGGVWSMGWLSRDLATIQAKKRGWGLGCRGFGVAGWGTEGGVVLPKFFTLIQLVSARV